MKIKRQRIVKIAETLALKPFHGKLKGLRSKINPIMDHFPDSPRKEFDGKWCAAFDIPYRYPSKKFGAFAGVRAWLNWAKLPEHQFRIHSI
jgi:hypothetical protein